MEKKNILRRSYLPIKITVSNKYCTVIFKTIPFVFIMIILANGKVKEYFNLVLNPLKR